MNKMLLYFLESGLAMALFYLIYRLFLQKETHYSVNRFYLLGTLLLSLVLPLLPLEQLFLVKQQLHFPAIFIDLYDSDASIPAVVISESGGKSIMLELFSVTRIIYLGGVVVLSLILLFQMVRLLSMKSVRSENHGPVKVIFVDREILPFSLFNLVYIQGPTGNVSDINTIIKHEQAHYRNLHFIDLMILECITIFQWFNPFSWLFLRSLKEIHEFQADDSVLSEGLDTGNYQALLVNQLTGMEVFRLSSAFSKSLTKKRMIMMTKIKSGKNAWLKSLIALPVLSLLLIGYSSEAKRGLPAGPIKVSGTVTEEASGEAMYGVHVVVQGTSKGTLTNMDGKYTLEVPDQNDKLVFSFVGYKSVITSGLRSPVDVKMKQTTYDINLDNVKASRSKDTKPAPNKKGKASKDKEGVEEVFFTVEDLAQFPGGKPALKEYLESHISYPEQTFAVKKPELATILVGFDINGKGKVENSHIVQGLSKAMEDEALRVVNEMPAWEPAKQRNKPVRSSYVLPVRFSKAFGAESADKFTDKPYYYMVDEMPLFAGKKTVKESVMAFREYIAGNLKYPKEALQAGAQGKVFVQFIIDEDGEIGNIKVVRGVHPALDKESVRVVSESPAWIPGKRKGKEVAVAFTFPVQYLLDTKAKASENSK